MSVRDALIGAAVLAACSSAALGQQQGEKDLYRLAPGYGWTGDHPSNPGPVGVRPIFLAKGKMRVSTRYDLTQMDGLRDRTSNVSNEQAFANDGYSYVPTTQTTRALVFEAAYGVTETLTLAAEVPYLDKEMDNLTAGGSTFRTSSKGVGDIRLWAHNKWNRWGSEQAFWSVALDIPTGSFDQTDARPGSAGPVVLPYSMQLGSGTYDLSPLLGWTGYDGPWSWGGNLMQTWRLFGPNDRRYTLGSRREASIWGGHALTDSLLANMRLTYMRQGDVHGSDPALDFNLSPAERGAQQKVKRLDLSAGLTFYQAEGALSGLRCGLEFGIPIYQKLRGPQLQTEYISTLRLQWSF